MYCRKCGNELKSTDVFCSVCGAKINDKTEINNDVESCNKESKFDRFMKKTFFRNQDLSTESLEKTGKVLTIGIVFVQILSFVLLLFFDIDLPIGGATLVWWLLDWYILNKQGVRGKWKIWGAFVIPVYLCIRAKKTDKIYGWAILSILVCVIGLGATVVSELSGTTELTRTSSEPALYEYEGYVEVDYDSTPYNDIEKYLPDEGMYYGTLAPEDSTEEGVGKDITEIFSVSDTEVAYAKYLGDAIVSYGRYQVLENSNGIKYCQNICKGTALDAILGKDEETLSYLLLEPDAWVELSDDKKVFVPTYAYTVTVPAGTFEHCICMITQENMIDGENGWADGEQITLDYYAPAVGKVFSFSMGDYIETIYERKTVINYELVSIDQNDALLENSSGYMKNTKQERVAENVQNITNM